VVVKQGEERQAGNMREKTGKHQLTIRMMWWWVANENGRKVIYCRGTFCLLGRNEVLKLGGTFKKGDSENLTCTKMDN
jgi:hypothetical protein